MKRRTTKKVRVLKIRKALEILARKHNELMKGANV